MKTYREHQRLYYDASANSWTKESDCLSHSSSELSSLCAFGSEEERTESVDPDPDDFSNSD